MSIAEGRACIMTDTNLKYRITGRYMDGASVVAYHITGSNGDERRVSREMLTYYIGRNMVINAKCQPGTEGQIIIRGVGMNLNDLPVMNIRTGEVKASHGGRSLDSVIQRNGAKKSQFEIISRIYNGNKNIGYVLRSSNGTERKLDRDTVLKLASNGMISNAQTSRDGEELILRGVGCQLDTLPRINLSTGASRGIEVVDDRQPVKEERDRISKMTDLLSKTSVARPFNKTVEVYWEKIQKVADEYGRNAVRDIRSNAQGAWKYPTLEVMDSRTSVMLVDAEKAKFEIAEIQKGISEESTGYGVRFVLTSNHGEGIEVRCPDISFLKFHLHNIGMIAYDVISKLYAGAKLREIGFIDKGNQSMWREYFNGYTGSTADTRKTEKTDKPEKPEKLAGNIRVNSSDLVTLDRVYTVEMSPLSKLGTRRTYPSVEMIKQGLAKLSIKTMNGYYICTALETYPNSETSLAVRLETADKQNSKVITYGKLSEEQLSLKNIILICCSAFRGAEQVELAIAESDIEKSVLAYYFAVKIH